MADFADYRQAVHVLQGNVHQHQTGSALAKQLQRLRAIAGGQRLHIRQLREAFRNQPAVGWRGVDDEDQGFLAFGQSRNPLVAGQTPKHHNTAGGAM